MQFADLFEPTPTSIPPVSPMLRQRVRNDLIQAILNSNASLKRAYGTPVRSFDDTVQQVYFTEQTMFDHFHTDTYKYLENHATLLVFLKDAMIQKDAIVFRFLFNSEIFNLLDEPNLFEILLSEIFYCDAPMYTKRNVLSNIIDELDNSVKSIIQQYIDGDTEIVIPPLMYTIPINLQHSMATYRNDLLSYVDDADQDDEYDSRDDVEGEHGYDHEDEDEDEDKDELEDEDEHKDDREDDEHNKDEHKDELEYSVHEHNNEHNNAHEDDYELDDDEDEDEDEDVNEPESQVQSQVKNQTKGQVKSQTKSQTETVKKPHQAEVETGIKPIDEDKPVSMPDDITDLFEEDVRSEIMKEIDAGSVIESINSFDQINTDFQDDMSKACKFCRTEKFIHSYKTIIFDDDVPVKVMFCSNKCMENWKPNKYKKK